MHGFIDERFMHNVFNDLLNILYSWVEFDVCIVLWQYIVGLAFLGIESVFYKDFGEVYIYILYRRDTWVVGGCCGRI